MQAGLQMGHPRFQGKESSSDERRVKAKISLLAAAALTLLAMVPASSSARMQSVEVSNKLCRTTGGGKFVDIPRFPGEKIDRRLLRDIRMLRRKYNIFITDGFSRDRAHSINGEHPLGLALDIVPNFAAGGSWNDIDRLAAWAEPRQDQPRAPFRWVGYNGDSGHGRGHHLHLSYSHSPSPPYEPADTMYSVRCPERDGDGKDGDGASAGGDGDGDGGGGGISPRAQSEPAELAPIAPESGGVSR